MAEATNSRHIGMRRGHAIVNLTPSQQLDVIAEGLPILLKSADDLLSAAESLAEHPRSFSVLTGHAVEEIAKILILVDIVRCPPNLRGGRLGIMFKWFYDHLARSIYAEAQSWKPTTVAELQGYVDASRQSHSLEGYVGEYILPNMTLFFRESQLYADIVAHEDGIPVWSEPSYDRATVSQGRPMVWEIVSILHDIGAFSRAGLDIVSDVWSGIVFSGEQTCYSAGLTLTNEMLHRLHDAGLIHPEASADQVRRLNDAWQIPMYDLNFKRIDVMLEDLKAAQEAAMLTEMGIGYECS